MASVAKDFHRLLKRVNRLTDGQVSIDDISWDESTLHKFDVAVRPNDGHYKGGKFVFTITLPEDYHTEDPPGVWCQTDIYHPNIDPTEEKYEDLGTNVCLNLFEAGRWNPSFGLEGIIHGLVFLMHNPNPDDPLSPYFEGTLEETFAENVKKYMTGVPFDEHEFVVDFIKNQNVDLELVDKDVTSETVEDGNTASSEVGNSIAANDETGETVVEGNTAVSGAGDSIAAKDETSETAVDTTVSGACNSIAAIEKNDTVELAEDTKVEHIELLGDIPNCNEEINNVKQLTSESEVEITVASTNSNQEEDDKLHNEINDKKNEVDDTLDEVHNDAEDDTETDFNELVFDGQCLFVSWSGDDNDVNANESVEGNNEMTIDRSGTSVEVDCATELNTDATANDTECATDSDTSANCPSDVKADSVCDTIQNSTIVHGEVSPDTLELVKASNVDEPQKCQACICGGDSGVTHENDLSAINTAANETNSKQCSCKLEARWEGSEKPCRILRSVSLPNPVTQNKVRSSATNQNDLNKDNVALKVLGSVLFMYDCLL